MLQLLQQEVVVGVVSVRELNANVSEVLARVEAGEIIDITKHGKPIIEMRPKRATKLDDPVFRANYERMVAGMREGVSGLTGPVSYTERTER